MRPNPFSRKPMKARICREQPKARYRRQQDHSSLRRKADREPGHSAVTAVVQVTEDGKHGDAAVLDST